MPKISQKLEQKLEKTQVSSDGELSEDHDTVVGFFNTLDELLTIVEERRFAESGREARPSGAAGANFFGGAVWGNFRENANCGDPPG